VHLCSILSDKVQVGFIATGLPSVPGNRFGNQGDQIGRIFANWAIVYFGQFLKVT
jgi:hypothetical protein